MTENKKSDEEIKVIKNRIIIEIIAHDHVILKRLIIRYSNFFLVSIIDDM